MSAFVRTHVHPHPHTHAHARTQGWLDQVGVGQLVTALLDASPASRRWAKGRGIMSYYMALFDLDGDGWVGGT